LSGTPSTAEKQKEEVDAQVQTALDSELLSVSPPKESPGKAEQDVLDLLLSPIRTTWNPVADLNKVASPVGDSAAAAASNGVETKLLSILEAAFRQQSQNADAGDAMEDDDL
jgi:gamma-glutamylcysteine synthetase